MTEGFVYIMSNKNKTVLYIGATKNLKSRVESHMLGKATVFTRKYSVVELVYFEKFANYHDAFRREQQFKSWHKSWKWNLVKSKSPQLNNLYLEL